MGKLDEISLAIGAQGEGLKSLNRTFGQHCDDDDRRHKENLDALHSISAEIRRMNETLSPVVRNVAFMMPIVQGVQISRWKAAGAMTLGSAILVWIGWMVTSFAGEVVKWLLPHIK